MNARLVSALTLIAALASSLPAQAQAFDLQAALKSLASGATKELTIPPGRYPLPKGGAMLSKLQGVTLHAEGVTWVAEDLQSPALTLDRCVGLNIVGLTIDYAPLPFTQGSITAVDREARTLEFEVHAGYPALEDAYLAERQMHLFDKSTRLWKMGAPDYYPKKIERLSSTRGRISFSASSEGIELIERGDFLALTIRKKSAVNIREGCQGLRFDGVTLHAAPGIGILSRFAQDGGTFHKVRVIPGPRPSGSSEDRLMSTSADAVNIAYTRKGPMIEDGEFSGMGDDGLNLHGVLLPMLKWLDARTFITMRPHKGEPFHRIIHEGDEMRFLREPSYAVVASAVVASVEETHERPDDWETWVKRLWPTQREAGSPAFFRVQLQSPVAGVEPGDWVEVPAINSSRYTVRNCHFHDHRARGLRLMACDGLVESNRFERLKGAAITVGGEFAFWREAGWCRKVTIRNNDIRDVGQGRNLQQPDSYTPGAIAIFSRVIPKGADTRYFAGNEDIELSKNLIDGCSVSGIFATAARRVRIHDNTIRRVNLSTTAQTGADYGLQGKEPILVIQAEAEIQGNQIEP